MNLEAIFSADTVWRAVIAAVAILGLAGIRAWQWREAERLKIRRAIARAGVEQNRLAIFDAEGPSDPPKIGPLFALLLSLGAFEAYTAARAQTIARQHLLGPRGPELLCWPPCAKGEVCEGKTCVRSAETETSLKASSPPTSYYESPKALYSDGRDPFERAPRL